MHDARKWLQLLLRASARWPLCWAPHAIEASWFWHDESIILSTRVRIHHPERRSSRNSTRQFDIVIMAMAVSSVPPSAPRVQRARGKHFSLRRSVRAGTRRKRSGRSADVPSSRVKESAETKRGKTSSVSYFWYTVLSIESFLQ